MISYITVPDTGGTSEQHILTIDTIPVDPNQGFIHFYEDNTCYIEIHNSDLARKALLMRFKDLLERCYHLCIYASLGEESLTDEHFCYEVNVERDTADLFECGIDFESDIREPNNWSLPEYEALFVKLVRRKLGRRGHIRIDHRYNKTHFYITFSVQDPDARIIDYLQFLNPIIVDSHHEAIQTLVFKDTVSYFEGAFGIAQTADQHRELALRLAAQALVELERTTTHHALLLTLAAVRHAAHSLPGKLAQHIRRRTPRSAALPLLVSRALRRTLEQSLPVHRLRGHAGDLSAIYWRPDGWQFLALSDFGTLAIWDVPATHATRVFMLRATDTLPQLEPLQPKPLESLYDMQPRMFGWNPTGDTLALAVQDRLGLYDPITGDLRDERAGIRGTGRMLVWTADGPRLVAEDDQHQWYVWDWITATSWHVPEATRAALSPDGRMVVSAHADGRARLWDAATGQVVRMLHGHTEALTAIVWRPDGQQVLTGSADRTARIWDVASGMVLQSLAGHLDGVLEAVWSPDGEQILTRDGSTVRRWLAATGTCAWMTAVRHCERLDWHPDSQQFLIAWDYHWEIWDGRTDQQRHKAALFPGGEPARWSPDGHYITVGGDNATGMLWEATSRQPMREIITFPQADVCWNATGSIFLVHHYRGPVEIRETSTGRVLLALSIPEVMEAYLSPDGRQFFITRHSSAPQLWDVTTGTVIGDLPFGRFYQAPAWSPDCQRIIFIYFGNPVMMYDCASAQITWTKQVKESADLVQWNPDGQQFITANRHGGVIKLWDPQTGLCLHEYRVTDSPGGGYDIAALGWDARGPLLLARVFGQGHLQLIHVTSGETFQHLEGTISYDLRPVAWSPDQRYLLAGDGTIAWIWDTQTGQAVQLLEGHEHQIQSIGWSQDGRQALTYDGTVRRWIVVPELLIAELIRRVCEEHIDSSTPIAPYPYIAEQLLRRDIPGWRGKQEELAQCAADLAQYTALTTP